MEGEGQVKELLKKDITLRLISGIIAIIIWLYVIDVQNPEVEETYKGIPVKIINQQAPAEFGLSMIGQDTQTIDVKVKGRRKFLANMNTDSFNVFADLSGFNKAGDISVPIQVQLQVQKSISDLDVKIVDYKPYNFKIKLDNVVQIQKPVIIEHKGVPKESFMAMPAQITPNVVTLKGPSSVIDTIETLRATVDISGQDKDVVSQPKYRIFNKKGEEIINNGIVKDVEAVNVVVAINKLKTVSVTLDYGGTLDNSSSIGKVQVMPSELTIVGKAEQIDNISQVFAGPVNLTKIAEDSEFDVPIRTPDGIQILERIGAVKVRMEIDKQISRVIPVQNLIVTNVPEGYTYKLTTKKIDVNVRGLQTDLENMKGTDIEAMIDMKNIVEGQHDVSAQVRIVSPTDHASAEVTGSYTATVILEKKLVEEPTPKPPVNNGAEQSETNNSNNGQAEGQ